ncbi:ANTAR domain-containing protein [Streptomyces chrestomyceticus JCM 4735]|uniref:ANTAR domain-containing protein n=1 Tax=Streptomyces chrestomyceticus JCM 4735 TaxID=1306181 RepID=A0A7U9PW84_9ACTN|nr:ANTAR domain-containing protein [Streptomyces chrestomyceticus]GCD33953.1 ANTAR domain-containing protein [Streptomyces chrestomyceticus JCM 4735]
MRRRSLAALRLATVPSARRAKTAEASGGPDDAQRSRDETVVDQLRAENAQLRRALDSRPVIDQARGILMATESCTAEQAWDILRQTSQHTNTKVNEVAGEVVASATGAAVPGPVRTQLQAAVDRHRAARRADG